ncbi:MAG: single-stranded DNA-binding protein [Chryseobacterium sp.]|uniref:single-stranded DNA-binding protein n=1 Tax=Chryseobacterium sp. G0201 TaxID=2487065 RepID=UPI000F510339|nr:single-stranded DNA-binding protein [Chryseobacterium sp. G0201]AZA54570.1 single-stranded DNA-binding protein [Chryseobacterium sp. G0201]MDN5477843.1 single-stranded DNA-binding protein [Chryseobacterium sp.]
MNIIGRLTADAKASILKDERSVVNFSIAVNDSYKNKQGEWIKLTEYVDCSFWQSPKVVPVLTQGTLVELTGWASARAWKDQSGEPKARINFHTSQFKVLKRGGKKSDETFSPQGSDSMGGSNPEHDDLPF